MTERELLAILYNFIVTKQIIVGDDASIKDMVVRYKFPPLSVLYPVCLRMTLQQSNELNEILRKAQALLADATPTPKSTPKVEDKILHDDGQT